MRDFGKAVTSKQRYKLLLLQIQGSRAKQTLTQEMRIKKTNPLWLFLPRKYKKFIPFLLLLGLGLGVFLPGRCISVADGDTITVMEKNGSVRKVRLYGIDAPELGQRFGQEAKAKAADIALLSNVNLEIMDTDKYGRSVAIVKLENGQILNEEMVKAGLAFVYEQFCKHPRCLAWKAYELKAKTTRAGLWADKKTMPPWVWRKKNSRQN